MDTNEIWSRHAARQAEKAAFVDTLAGTLGYNPVGTLAVASGDYGYGGAWVESSLELDTNDLRALALAAWYDLHNLPTPEITYLHEEARALANVAARVAPVSGQLRALRDLRDWLTDGWCAETSADPEGYERHGRGPYGQCAVTALLVQQVAGGVLARVEVTDTAGAAGERPVTVSHYYNVLADGTEIDLTRGQFTRFVSGQNVTAPQVRDRSYLLGHDGTRSRYQLLADRVGLPFRETVA